MADPLSVAASAAGLITLAGAVLGKCYTYTCSVANAPSEAKRLADEVTILTGVLAAVQGITNHSEVDLDAKHMTDILKVCGVTLLELESLLNSTSYQSKIPRTQRTFNRVLWPLTKAKTVELVAQIQAQKSTLMIMIETLTAKRLKVVAESVDDINMEIRSAKKVARRQAILKWLSPLKAYDQHERIRRLHCEGTCEWLKIHPAFQQWLSSGSSLLWLSGDSGVGKTILASEVVELLQGNPRADLLGYHYFDSSMTHTLTAHTCLGSILRQICGSLAGMPKCIEDAFDEAREPSGEKRTLSTHALERLMVDVLEHEAGTDGKCTYIILDGLDESGDLDIVAAWATFLSENLHFRAKIFVSCQPNWLLRPPFKSCIPIAVTEDETRSDIQLYIRQRLGNDPRIRNWDAKLQKSVEETLQHNANGMIRWVQCQLDEVTPLRTKKSIEDALSSPLKTLGAVYDHILFKISQKDLEWAKRALMLLMEAPEPPQLRTLAEFAIFDPETKSLDIDSRFNDPTAILEICSSLVTYEANTGQVRIAHHSVRQHLSSLVKESSLLFKARGIQGWASEVAAACLSYLLLDDFAHGPVEHHTFVEQLANYPLLAYAAQNWTFHVRCIGFGEPRLDIKISRLMTPQVNARFLFWVQVMLYHSGLDFQIPGISDSPTTLYYAASNGLYWTVRDLIATGVDLNIRAGRFGGTALHAACWRRYQHIIQLLLGAGADCSIKDNDGNTAYDLLDLEEFVDKEKFSLTVKMNPGGDAISILASRMSQSSNQTELDRYMNETARGDRLCQSPENARLSHMRDRPYALGQIL